ncbi:MAG: hypothetical protein SFX73_04070 [Kofleriaceae bacterium]|nr:hypothetical protein [Kofleriaceae bacterium]
MRRYLLLLVALSGCDLYFGGDGDDAPPPCKDVYYGEPIDGGAALGLRNPETGECEGWGGGDMCPPDACGCYTAHTSLPDWGYCTSECTGLDEASCLAAPGCNASYDLLVGIPEEMTGGSAFTGCWDTAQSGPVQGGSCYNLDAHECSRHDDCSMFYDAGRGDFVQCAPEPSSQGCELLDCAPGNHCEEQCYPCDSVTGEECPAFCVPTCVPDVNQCTADCGPGYECITACTDALTTPMGVVPGECYATCVPVNGGDPGECTGEVLCDAIGPACPSGTVAGIKNGCYTGYCIPQAACGPSDPGGCEPAICATPGPACPPGTVGGTNNGCWTGYCIPESACPQALCEELTDEQACTSRFDCRAVYTGDNCTCDANGCTCEELSFARCESQLWI